MPRKEALHEKSKAQGEITKKRLKKIYSYFEKKSDPVIVKIMQLFIGVLLNKEPEKIGPHDVELYLKRHSGLMIACNKIDAFTINKTLAGKFLDDLKTLHEEIKLTKYANYVPFYCWVDQQCRLCKISVEIRQVEEEMGEFNDDIADFETQKEKKKMVLAFMKCDPEADESNERQQKEWGGETQDVFEQMDRDMGEIQDFERGFLAKMK